jgi:hypothetical protein
LTAKAGPDNHAGNQPRLCGIGTKMRLEIIDDFIDIMKQEISK